jgi:hypothetical protein
MTAGLMDGTEEKLASPLKNREAIIQHVEAGSFVIGDSTRRKRRCGFQQCVELER